MSAPAIAAPAPAVAARVPREGGAREFWLAALYFLAAAFIVTMWLWRDPASRIVAANPYDSDQFAWYFRYDATAVAHLRLPALSTTGMNAPHGVNLMWNTPMFGPGVLLAPLTLLAGPQASLTALMTLGFAGSALALFAVLRRRGVSLPAAAAGGLAYGFSPALVQSAQGHYDLQFAVLPPLIVDAALRLAADRCPAGRRAAIRLGLWLGLLVTAQVFITEEFVFDAALAAAIAAGVLAASGLRPEPGRIADTVAGAATALGVLAAGAGYPLWEQFFGPVRQHGSPFQPDYYKNDLATFVRPPASELLHSHSSAAFAAAFQGQSPEYLGYLGWPLLIALTVIAAAFWRRPRVRAAAVTFAVLELLSLGGTLMAGGHDYAWLKLPWYWVQTLPLIGSAIPDRFSILADGAAAVLLAFGLDAARARWPARRWVIAAAAVAALVPLVPRPLPAAVTSGVPAGWTATFAGLRLPDSAPVLVVPVPMASFTEPLRWQAGTGVPSSMFGGYFMGPGENGHAETDGAGTPPGALDLNRLWARPRSAPATADAAIQNLIRTWHPAAVVAVTRAGSPLGRYLTALLGPATARAGGVLGWRLNP